jgi:hypothetical protein
VGADFGWVNTHEQRAMNLGGLAAELVPVLQPGAAGAIRWIRSLYDQFHDWGSSLRFTATYSQFGAEVKRAGKGESKRGGRREISGRGFV